MHSFRKPKLARLTIGGAILFALVVAGLWFAGYTPNSIWHIGSEAFKHAMAFLRALGPLAFFTAMALLPSVGFPLLGFTVIAAPLFESDLGIWTVAALVLLSFSINVSLTYWISRYAMRPLCTRFLSRLGYSVPVLDRANHLGITLVVRLTPGPPFFAQNYLLGLMEVSFVTYYLVSLVITGTLSVSLVFFGESLMQGSGGKVFLGSSLVVVVFLLIRMARKQIAARTSTS